MMNMKNSSYLIQRLNAPYAGFTDDNPFAFGGGLKNGGLTDDAMSLLRGIFSFDYMGAAEFEFGAVPQALNLLAKAELEAGSFEIDTTTIYILGPQGQADEIEQRVRSWLLPHVERPYMKEQPRLDRVLEGATYVDTKGWLEISNGWFAFVDREMWEKTCSLFGVGV